VVAGHPTYFNSTHLRINTQLCTKSVIKQPGFEKESDYNKLNQVYNVERESDHDRATRLLGRAEHKKSAARGEGKLKQLLKV